MHLKGLIATVGTTTLLASSLVLSTPAAQAASYTKCVHDAPLTTCVTTSGGKSLGWNREGSYLFPKSKVDTTNTCSVTKTSSETFKVSLAVSGEWSAWIFAKVNVTITGGWEHETTMTAGASRVFTQKAGETYRCEWGEARYQSKISVTKTVNGTSTTKTGTATGPQEMQLRVTKL
jgi:hypothetical protein